MSSESHVAAPSPSGSSERSVRVGGELADRHGAEAQVHGKIRRSLRRREVAGVAVAIDALAKVGEERRAAAHARPRRRSAFEVASARNPCASSDGIAPDDVRRRRRERVGVRSTGCGCRSDGRQRLEPGVPVRREHAERRAGLRQHLVALEDHLVLGGPERDAAVGERLRDGGVAIAAPRARSRGSRRRPRRRARRRARGSRRGRARAGRSARRRARAARRRARARCPR